MVVSKGLFISQYVGGWEGHDGSALVSVGSSCPAPWMVPCCVLTSRMGKSAHLCA